MSGSSIFSSTGHAGVLTSTAASDPYFSVLAMIVFDVKNKQNEVCGG
jgi:hypothetical protein